MAQDWMPHTLQARLNMGRNWVNIVTVRGAGWGVPAGTIIDLKELVEQAEAAQAVAVRDTANKAQRHQRDRFVNDMVAFMRDVRRRHFFNPPLTEEDFIVLGIPLPDTIRTPHIEVPEIVEFTLILRNIREILVRFKVEGAVGDAKPLRYDGAVVIWAVRDTPPNDPGDLTNHSMASRTPHTLSFTEEERGRTVYVSLAWQNERGNIGAWSKIQSAVIP